MNARVRNLYGTILVGQDLSRANFAGALLAGVEIHQCNLANASFQNAMLSHSVIIDCDTSEADFSDADVAASTLRLSLDQISQTRSYRQRDLQRCFIEVPSEPSHRGLVKFDFRNFDLRGTRFLGGGYLTSCTFNGAKIKDAEFAYGRVRFAQLATTYDFQQRIVRAKFGGLDGACVFDNIFLRGSDFYLITPDDDTFVAADINECTIRGGFTARHLKQTLNYARGQFLGITFWSLDVSKQDLSGFNFTESHFRRCDFTNANLENTVISGVSFAAGRNDEIDQSKGLTVDQIKSTWNYKHGRMKGIRLPDELAAALAEEAQASQNEEEVDRGGDGGDS